MVKSFSVKTSVFEGPLDLLLELINKRKLFVSDVSLAQVTDDFIRYIEEHESAGGRISIAESAEFIVVASTLMLVKSRSLLPGLQLTEEEEESISDLEQRLALYAYMKELSLELKQRYGKTLIYEKTPSKTQPVIFAPDSKTDVNNLILALQGVLETLPKENILPKAVVKKMISLEEIIESLAERISKSLKMNFKEAHGLSSGKVSNITNEQKVSIIIGFLAMLELVKRGIIRATQTENGEIEMERENL
ncbi:MAG: segregation/condensation protein A [bacterium]